MSNNTLGQLAFLAIKKHSNKIWESEKSVLKDEDPEALHQMRVGMRRLRTAVTGFAAVVVCPNTMSPARIGKIAQQLGQLRDIDVLQETLKNDYQASLPTQELKLLKLANKYLSDKRKKVFMRVEQMLVDKSYQRLKESVIEWLEKPCYSKIADVSLEQNLPSLIYPQVSQFFLAPGWLVGVKITDGQIDFIKDWSKEAVVEELAIHGTLLHNLRKEAKKVRYQMELFLGFYGEGYYNYFLEIKAVQEILGCIQDGMVLSEFLSGVFEADIAKVCPVLSGQLAKTCYDAWLSWIPLQKKYLELMTKQNFYHTIIQEINISSGSGQLIKFNQTISA